MKVGVVGLWHLGTVTAGCLADGAADVVAWDPDEAVLEGLREGRLPVDEPGLADLLDRGTAAGRLRYADSPAGLGDRDVVWITFDTPVDDDDRADAAFVVDHVNEIVPLLANEALVVVSSQLPVGTVRSLAEVAARRVPGKNLRFACIPENLRLGRAIEVFTRADRFVVGVDDDRSRRQLETLLSGFTDTFVWMSVESAEMTKHAINAFLATSVVFANELARFCEHVGADMHEVAGGMKSDVRIGRAAYVRPGAAFAGGTLARDVSFLAEHSAERKIGTTLFDAVRRSNVEHRGWVRRRLVELLGGVRGRTVAMLGLTYKAGTNTLRRSVAVEDCCWLTAAGATVQAYDPTVSTHPDELPGEVELCSDVEEALRGADAVVVATEWPEFREVSPRDVVEASGDTARYVLDPNGFLAGSFGHGVNGSAPEYLTVGRAA